MQLRIGALFKTGFSGLSRLFCCRLGNPYLLERIRKKKEKDLKMGNESGSELNTFIEQWQETPEKNREAFLHFREHLNNKEGVSLEFVSRPHITYSLRAVHAAQKKRGLFVLIDVIEDTPRWLSMCFYAEMITDPENRGTCVPEGLLGEDAVCFDIVKRDEKLIRYLEIRLDEACRKAKLE